MDKPVFIKLTTAVEKTVWINMSKVWRICRGQEDGSLLYISTGDTRQYVMESPETVIALMAKEMEK